MIRLPFAAGAAAAAVADLARLVGSPCPPAVDARSSRASARPAARTPRRAAGHRSDVCAEPGCLAAHEVDSVRCLAHQPAAAGDDCALPGCVARRRPGDVWCPAHHESAPAILHLERWHAGHGAGGC